MERIRTEKAVGREGRENIYAREKVQNLIGMSKRTGQ